MCDKYGNIISNTSIRNDDDRFGIQCHVHENIV